MVARQQSILAGEAKPLFRLAVLNHSPACVNEVAAGLIVLGLGGMTFLFPSVGMPFSTMVVFLLAIRRVAPAIASINGATVKLNQLRRDIEVIEQVLHLSLPEKHGHRLVSEVEEIRLVNVSFYYSSRPEEYVSKGIDLVLRRGTMTAIVGPTGAGKSTIANLIVGLYKPSSGAIWVNGADLQLLEMAAWRQKIGYVCQDTFLFNATLRENIVLWDEGVSEAVIEWASRVAQLHDFVLTLPDGYDTVVGDRGLKLSGGQCQRVAIARAILRRPQVLIFDEATSALDNLTEKAVYGAISALRANAIVLVIAHRLSTVRDADEIAVLQSGRVIETGTHDTLMTMRGAYAALYEGDGHKSSEIPAESGSDRAAN
jgi:ABC-type multidrug transport system fused ATPase/permease subunit